MFASSLGPEGQKLRKQYGLSKLRASHFWELFFREDIPTIAAWSPAVSPPPPDWPRTVHTTGYWTVPQSEQLRVFEPAPELKEVRRMVTRAGR